jgi:GT2 family glycosyltransferase
MDHPTLAPVVTFLISTYNRREVLLGTLAELSLLGQRTDVLTETIVVDNASTDGTAAAIAATVPDVRVVRLDRNLGACGKNAGLPLAGGEFVVFLDDDSYPTVDTVHRLIEHFGADEQLGAAVFTVTLPDGSQECSAYPNVAIGCGTAFRRVALEQVGGLPTDFFMAAEEYDVSLRLLGAGWDVRRFDDLHVRHLKTPGARQPTRISRLDARNNLMLATRYLPRKWVVPFAVDWARRYWWIAGSKGPGHRRATAVGLAQGLARSLRPGHRRPIGQVAFERFSRGVDIHRRLDKAVRVRRARSIVLVDVGKNLLPFYNACRACGLQVVAIADDRLAAAGRTYHGIPVVTDAVAAGLDFDAAVVANLSPVHARLSGQRWRELQVRPVIDLFEPVAESAPPMRMAA